MRGCTLLNNLGDLRIEDKGLTQVYQSGYNDDGVRLCGSIVVWTELNVVLEQVTRIKDVRTKRGRVKGTSSVSLERLCICIITVMRFISFKGILVQIYGILLVLGEIMDRNTSKMKTMTRKDGVWENR